MNVDTPQGMEQAKAWLIGWLTMLAPQATWVVPQTGSIIQIDKTTKTATITMCMFPETATKKVFRALGWKVVDNFFPDKELN